MERIDTPARKLDQITVNLQASDVERLDEVAHLEQISRSAVARQILSSGLRERTQALREATP